MLWCSLEAPHGEIRKKKLPDTLSYPGYYYKTTGEVVTGQDAGSREIIDE